MPVCTESKVAILLKSRGKKKGMFITQRYPNQVEKAIFSPKVFWYPIIFCFHLIFLKKLGTKKPLVKKLLLDLIRVALGDEHIIWHLDCVFQLFYHYHYFHSRLELRLPCFPGSQKMHLIWGSRCHLCPLFHCGK